MLRRKYLEGCPPRIHLQGGSWHFDNCHVCGLGGMYPARQYAPDFFCPCHNIYYKNSQNMLLCIHKTKQQVIHTTGAELESSVFLINEDSSLRLRNCHIGGLSDESPHLWAGRAVTLCHSDPFPPLAADLSARAEAPKAFLDKCRFV
jgi:hypothetical protein